MADQDKLSSTGTIVDEEQVTPDILCALCQTLFDEDARWPSGSESRHSTKDSRLFCTYGNLCAQANAGCHLCSMLQSSLQFPGDSRSEYKDECLDITKDLAGVPEDNLKNPPPQLEVSGSASSI